jgi:hypothetical protein
MPEQETHQTIKALLTSALPDELRRGLVLLQEEIDRAGNDEAAPLFEFVSALFYIDALDRPELAPVLNEAVSVVVRFGPSFIPALLSKLEDGDLKAQLVISHALGRMGADAVEPLMAAYRASTDTGRRCFILYALARIKSPEVGQVVALARDAADSPDMELRDTGTRAIGKLAESVPPEQIPEALRRELIEKLRANLASSNAVIRAKAVRSFGKLARFGHLTAAERDTLRGVCQSFLGRDESFDWDRAYIVRREAEEALSYL